MNYVNRTEAKSGRKNTHQTLLLMGIILGVMTLFYPLHSLAGGQGQGGQGNGGGEANQAAAGGGGCGGGGQGNNNGNGNGNNNGNNNNNDQNAAPANAQGAAAKLAEDARNQAAINAVEATQALSNLSESDKVEAVKRFTAANKDNAEVLQAGLRAVAAAGEDAAADYLSSASKISEKELVGLSAPKKVSAEEASLEQSSEEDEKNETETLVSTEEPESETLQSTDYSENALTDVESIADALASPSDLVSTEFVSADIEEVNNLDSPSSDSELAQEGGDSEAPVTVRAKLLNFAETQRRSSPRVSGPSLVSGSTEIQRFRREVATVSQRELNVARSIKYSKIEAATNDSQPITSSQGHKGK